MDIQLLSFILAIVVASMCFGLVKFTADEFDRWYDEPHIEPIPTAIRVPPAVRILSILLAFFLIVR